MIDLKKSLVRETRADKKRLDVKLENYETVDNALYEISVIDKSEKRIKSILWCKEVKVREYWWRMNECCWVDFDTVQRVEEVVISYTVRFEENGEQIDDYVMCEEIKKCTMRHDLDGVEVGTEIIESIKYV